MEFDDPAVLLEKRNFPLQEALRCSRSCARVVIDSARAKRNTKDLARWIHELLDYISR